jgi:hypothetical protein
MSSNVQTISASSPSICVPYILDRVEKSTITNTFKILFGERNIERIDVVFREKDNGEKFKRVFVHFHRWPDTRDAQIMRERLLRGEEVKIVYDEPWFWKCRASQVAKPEARPVEQVPYVCVEEGIKATKLDNSQIQIPRPRRVVLPELIPRQVMYRQKNIEDGKK